MKNKKNQLFGIVLIILGTIITSIYSDLHEPSNGSLLILFLGLVGLSLGLAMASCKDRYILNASRIFIGIIFIFSGWVKAVDPLGSTYKFIDYFDAWGIGFFNPMAFTFGLFQSVLEFLIGFALLFNIFSKYASTLGLLFMIFFTPVTLYLALQEQITGQELVHDCGCFGDALVITNWQTFVKNLLILIPSIFIFIKRKEFVPKVDCKKQIMITLVATIGIIFISIYGYMNLPIQDYRPYKVGANIKEGMAIPEGAPQPIYMSYFKYKNINTGEIKEFDQNNLPYEDTENWEYVEDQTPTTKLIQKGYTPPVNNFSIFNSKEGDITDEVISDTNYNFIIVAYDIKKTSLKNINKIIEIKNFAEKNNYEFRILTASAEEDIKDFVEKTNSNFKFYNTDPITLKTIVRSNPGIVLLKDATIINKWHHRNTPSINELEKLIN